MPQAQFCRHCGRNLNQLGAALPPLVHTGFADAAIPDYLGAPTDYDDYVVWCCYSRFRVDPGSSWEPHRYDATS